MSDDDDERTEYVLETRFNSWYKSGGFVTQTRFVLDTFGPAWLRNINTQFPLAYVPWITRDYSPVLDKVI